VAWTFDYTVIFAVGSLAIILAGTLVYYLGMLFCDRIEIEYGKIGIPKRYDKIKYYKYGALFLDVCVKRTIMLSIAAFFLLGITLSIGSEIGNSLNIHVNITDNEIYTLIFLVDFAFIFVQLSILIWNLEQIGKCDNENYKYDKKIHQRCIDQSSISIISLITVIFVSIFIIITLNSPIPSSLNIFHFILIVFMFSAICIIAPVIIGILNMSNIAYLHGHFYALLEISEYKSVDEFIVHFLDGRILNGQKLSYENGIYTLGKSSKSDNKELDYEIYEDKIHHIEKIYNNERDDFVDLDTIAKEMAKKFGTISKCNIGYIKKENLTEKVITSVKNVDSFSGDCSLKISKKAKKELSVDAIRVLIAHEFSHWSNNDSTIVNFYLALTPLIIFIVIGLFSFVIYRLTNLLICPDWLGNSLLFLALLCIYPFYSIVSVIQETRADAEAFQAIGNIMAVKDYLGGLKKNKESFWSRCIHPHPKIQQREACIDFILEQQLINSFDKQNKPKNKISFTSNLKCIWIYVTKNTDISNATELLNLELAVKVLNNVRINEYKLKQSHSVQRKHKTKIFRQN
jgi:hypothetical protein